MKKITTLVLFSFVLVLTLISLNFISGLTGSIGNAKMVLYPEVGFFEEVIEKYILVKNVNNVTINISLDASSEIKDIIEIKDANFQLIPGEEKKAYFEIHLDEPGNYDGKINVYFKPLGEKEAGVALASNIVIRATKGSFFGSDGEEETEQDSVNLNALNNTDNLLGISKIWLFALIIPVLLIVLLVLLWIYSRKIKEAKKLNSKKRRHNE